jgi:lysophospholipase L1-like esterase
MAARPRSGRPIVTGLLASLLSLGFLAVVEVALRWLPAKESRLSLAVILDRQGGLEEIQRTVQDELRTETVDPLEVNRIYAEDDATFWRLRRNLTLTGRNYVLPRAVRERYPFTVTLNADGFRGPALPLAKPADALRVIAVGDSSTFGWGVNDDETYPADLARRLAAAWPGRPVEVMNAGIPGFGSFQGKHLLEAEVLPRKPDYVVLGFGFNDSRRAATTDAAFAETWSRPTARAARVFHHLAIYRWLETLLARPDESARPSADDAARSTPRVPVPEFKTNLREMLSAARSAGGRPILLALVMPVDYRGAIAELARESGTPLLSTLLLFQTRMGDPAVRAAHAEAIARHEAAWRGEPPDVFRNPAYADRIHPSAIGQDLIAEWLADAIGTMEGRAPGA